MRLLTDFLNACGAISGAAMSDMRFKCAGCGNYANDVGSTFCQCATSVLVRSSDQTQLVKPFLLHREIEAITAQHEETIAIIRAALSSAIGDEFSGWVEVVEDGE